MAAAICSAGGAGTAGAVGAAVGGVAAGAGRSRVTTRNRARAGIMRILLKGWPSLPRSPVERPATILTTSAYGASVWKAEHGATRTGPASTAARPGTGQGGDGVPAGWR